MELFSLLAKLTLDKKEFDSAISEAENEARGINIENPELGLNDDAFYQGIDDAESTDVDDPDSPELGLDKTEFDKNIQEAESSGQLFSENLGSIFSELKGVLVASGIVAAVSGVVSSLKEGVELAKNHGDQIDKQSQKMMLSKKAYQEYAYALGLSGASIDDLNRGMRNLQKIPGAGLTEDQVKAFEALGISAEDAMKQITEGMEKEDLTGFVDRIVSGIADADSADQGWIAAALFGNGATGLNAFFNQTSQQIRDAKQEAEDLGMVMSDEEVANAAAYMDATSRMEGAIQGLKEALVKDLLPYLTDAANTIAKIVAFFNPRAGQKSLADQFTDGDEKFAEELVTIEGTAAAAETLADKLLAMGDTSKMTAEQYAIWEGTAKSLIDLVPSLSAVIDTETGKITANSEEIKENIRQWENLAKQKALQTLKEEKYQMLVESNQQLIDKNVDLNVKEAEAAEKKAIAIEKANELMGKNATISAKFRSTFGQDTITDWSQVQWLEMATQHYTGFGELNQYINDFIVANQEAVNAGEDVKTLTEQLEEGKRQYEAWLASAEELYGIPSSEADNATESVKKFGEELDKLPLDKTVHIHAIYDDGTEYRPHAIGSAYIPFDNYPALLHRGEKIMTATDARRDEQSGRLSTDFEDRVIAAIREGIADAQVTAVVTDKQVAKGSNRYNGNEMDARRFRP